MSNGDVNVEEIFDYRFNGEFQGVFREYYGGTIIAIIYGFVKLFKKISKIRFEKALAKYRSKINDIQSVKFYDNHYNIPSDISPAYINLISLDFKKDNLAIIDVMMYLVNKGVYSIEKEKNLML